MSLTLIAAFAKNGVMGLNNDLPWHISDDLKRFKKITSGHTIVMGRKTYESIGKPLPHRRNVVLTRNQNWTAKGVDVVQSVDSVLEQDRSRSFLKTFIIGGAEIYRLFWPHVSELELTLVHHDIKGDTIFPGLKWKQDFELTFSSGYRVCERSGLTYEFISAKRR